MVFSMGGALIKNDMHIIMYMAHCTRGREVVEGPL